MLHPVDLDLLNFFLFSDKLTPESMVEEQRQAEENRGYMECTKQAGSQRDENGPLLTSHRKSTTYWKNN